MKFTINKDEFLKALLNASKIIPSKATNAILSKIKLDLYEDKLEITGSNKEISIKNIIPKFKDDKAIIRDIVPGSLLISAKMLTEIIRRLDSEDISFIVEDNATAKIMTSKSVYNLNILKAEEYDDIDFEEKGAEIEINKDEFISAINQTAFAASLKDSRAVPVLECVNIESDEFRIIFTATDGARLGKRWIDAKTGVKFNINVPSKNINEVIRSISEEEKTIKLFVDEKRILFVLKDCVIITTVLIGEYPNTRSIIPTNYFYKLEVNTNEFLKALDRSVLFTADRQYIVTVSMSDEAVEISSRSSQEGDAKENIQLFKYEGDRLQISFNTEYVGQAIRALKCDEVVFKFLGVMKPFTISNKNDDKVVQIITPVKTY